MAIAAVDFIPPGRSLPHSIDAERAVLGALLLHDNIYDGVAFLSEEHFVLSEHKVIFREYRSLVEAGRLADPITVKVRLDNVGALESVGGIAYLASLADCAVSAINAREYARVLDELLVRRRLIQAGDDVIATAYDGDRSVAAEAAEALERVIDGSTDDRPRQWAYRDPTTIPPRPWLLGRTMLRGEVSGLGGHGGRGKTTLAIAMALSMASGRNLIGHRPVQPLRVLYLHMEEPDDEMDRRVAAAVIRYGLSQGDIGDRLHLRTGAMSIVDVDEYGMPRPRHHAARAMLRSVRPDAVFVDPFRMSFAGEENSNDTQNEVVRAWKRLAGDTGCGIMLVHHFRKGVVEAGDASAFRGGGAFIDACRAAFTLTRCTPEEADGFGLSSDDAASVVRLDDAKQNMSKDEGEAWYKLGSVRLGNSTDLYPYGDSVQVIEGWEPPDVFDGVTPQSAREILEAIDAGTKNERYTKSRRGSRWAGMVIDEHLGCGEQKARRILATWISNGVLYEQEYESPSQRRPRLGLYLDRSKLPG